MGKVVQEWNPTPPPLLPQTTPAPAATTAAAATNVGLNTGFNDLLSQVASASGIDIEKPPGPEEKEEVKENEIVTKLPEYQECIEGPYAYVNIAFEDKDSNSHLALNEQEKAVSNNQEPLTNSKEQIITQTNQNIPTLHSKEHLLKIEPRIDEPTRVTQLDELPDIKLQSEHVHPVKLNGEKGISVSIQTRIINTRITKARARRRKDIVYPKCNEYSDSTSEKETRRGYLLPKKDNLVGCHVRGASKYKKRKKRNQISFQEKILTENALCDIPISMQTDLNKNM